MVRGKTTVKYVVTNKVHQLGNGPVEDECADEDAVRTSLPLPLLLHGQLIHIYGIFAFSRHHFVM